MIEVNNERRGHEVKKIITGDEWEENSYIVIDHEQKKQFIIDPGFGLINAMGEHISGSYKTTHILVTHPHHDHIGGAEDISKLYNIPCIIHPSDKRAFMHVTTYCMRFAKKSIERPSMVRWIDEDVKREILDEGIEIVETPGHTRGSCCYLYKNCIFTGDTLQKEHIGRTDLPESSKQDLKQSVSFLIENINDEYTIYPGHGKLWNMTEAKEWWQQNKESAKEYRIFGNKEKTDGESAI